MTEISPPSEKILKLEDDGRLDELEDLVRLADLPTKELQGKFRSLEDAQDKLRICCEHMDKIKAIIPVDYEKFGELKTLRKSLQVDVIPQLQQEKSNRDTEMSEPTEEISEKAFQVEYLDNEDTANFISHMEQQREKFMAREGMIPMATEGMSPMEGREIGEGIKAPYFPLFQSSGYGKSRLIAHIRETHSTDYLVIYWSFGEERAYPRQNVELASVFEKYDRHALERAFVRAIKESLLEVTTKIGNETPSEARVSLNTKDPVPDDHVFAFKKKVIFVIDEASDLLGKKTKDNVSYFRCLCRAMHVFKDQTKYLLFVVMATYFSISQFSPELSQFSPDLSADPSHKFIPINMEQTYEPLEPFLLMATYSVHNDRSSIMAKSIEDCLTPASLLIMGRPLWQAYKGPGKLNATGLVDFALQKLLLVKLGKKRLIPAELNPFQRLALLASRLCLSISPTTLYASTLVAGYMARADAVSRDRLALTVSYPSEPVLAIASRNYTRKYSAFGVTAVLLTTLTELLANGAVSKGHRGEVVARFLLLWAMDQQMNCQNSGVQEVGLERFLNAFSRESHAVPLNAWSEHTTKERFKDLMSATVCFTHFVYLSKDPKVLITQDLLRYAYRRTAALVVEEGRKGIDLMIPLRLGKTDNFIGLVIQVKNRKNDEIESLEQGSNDTTHANLHPRYFLDEPERTTFPEEWREFLWPAILLAVGIDEPGAAVAETPNLLMNKTIVPCMILTGLNYSFLTDNDVTALKLFRDFHLVIPGRGMRSTPLTYDGCLVP